MSLALGGGSRTELQLARRVSMRASSYYARLRPGTAVPFVLAGVLRIHHTLHTRQICGKRRMYTFTHLYIHVHLSVSSGNKTLAIHALTHRRCTRDHPVSCKLYSWGHPTQHTRASHVHCHSIPNTCPTTLSVRTHSSSRVQLGLKLGVEIGHICLLQH